MDRSWELINQINAVADKEALKDLRKDMEQLFRGVLVSMPIRTPPQRVIDSDHNPQLGQRRLLTDSMESSDSSDGIAQRPRSRSPCSRRSSSRSDPSEVVPIVS